MTYPGLGGQQPPPQNAAPAAPLVPGVQPGTSSQVVASRVIIIGTGGELLVYSPTAGAGNLLLSVAGSAGTDSFGNSFPAGLTVGFSTGPQVQINESSGVARIVATPGNASFVGGEINGGTTGSPLYASMGIIGPASTDPAHDDFMEEAFNSANASGTSQANIQWFYVDTSGVAHQVMVLNGTELFVDVALFTTHNTLDDGSGNAAINGALTVGGSSDTGVPTINATSTNGVSSPGTTGTSGPASTGTAHTHSAGSYQLGSGQHSHDLQNHEHPL